MTVKLQNAYFAGKLLQWWITQPNSSSDNITTFILTSYRGSFSSVMIMPVKQHCITK